MPSAISPPSSGESIPVPSRGEQAVLLLRGGMEIVVLVMVSLSPWAFGGANPLFEFLLYTGLAVLLAAWGARMLLERQLSWRKCPLAVCLAGLFLLGVWQMTPLPRSLLETLSPATARLYGELLPSQPERMDASETRDSTAGRAGSTLSLYPAATRTETVRLLAVFLLFVVVRNNVTSPAALKRLAVVALANGALLALFGFIQFFSSARGTLYWSFPTRGDAFGPFINRNHFAFYLNLCIGLGVGLLLGRHSHLGASSQRPSRGGRTNFAPPSGLLHDPPALWLSIALAVMVGSVLFCLSRGGFVALACGGILCLFLRPPQSFNAVRLPAAALAVILALGLLAWFGFGRVQDRLATLWEGEAAQTRLSLWQDVLPLSGEFPLWGTGYGTFRYVEPMRRSTAADLISEHAENDYLEALVEGGLARLLLSLAAVVLVARLGYRALKRHRNTPEGPLVLGLLFAFTTLAVHSFVDFGLHVPAISVLAVVLAGHLASLGAADPVTERILPTASASRDRPRFRGVAPLAGALAAGCLSMVLCAEGWKAYRVDTLRMQGFALESAGRSASRTEKILPLAEALRLRPDDAYLHLQLGKLLIDEPDWTKAAPPASKHLASALRHYCQARDLCPLMPEAHVRIAAYTEQLKSADSRTAYLERAKRLLPSDPEIWFLCGLQEVSGKPDRAWQNWRHSLVLSDRYLLPILDRSRQDLSSSEILEKVLPDDPHLLLKASSHLFPPEAPEGQKPFLEKALTSFAKQGEPLTATDFHAQALIQSSLGKPAETLAAYQKALARDPQQADWRLQFAQLLLERGQLHESRRELITILGQAPKHARARELLEAVAEKIARKSGPGLPPPDIQRR